MQPHLSTQLEAYKRLSIRPHEASPSAVLALFSSDEFLADHRTILRRKDVRELCLRLVEQFHVCVPSSLPGIPLSLSCVASLASTISSGSSEAHQARSVASQFESAARYRVARSSTRKWELWDPCFGGVYAWALEYHMNVKVSPRPIFSDQASADHAARLVLIEQVFVGTAWEATVPLLIEEYACATHD